MRKFIGNVRILKDSLNCAVILVHHTHKDKWTNGGDRIEEDDEAIFGSKFFKAWADHTILFKFDKDKNIRTLSCNTQRSGDIVGLCSLRLVQPDPLYFEELGKGATKEEQIIDFLKYDDNHGVTAKDIMDKLSMSKNTFYVSIKRPLNEGIIKRSKVDGDMRYTLKGVKK